MNIQTITKILTDAGIEKNEAKYEIKMLLEHFCNYTDDNKIRGILPDNTQLEVLYHKVLERVKERVPVQYITGKAWFMGEYFKVSPDVLIPRDETELLVTRCLEIIKHNGFNDILDIGTGSGCIACTIAKNSSATVLGIDISTDALRIALDNVTRLGLNNRAIFRKSNLFEKIRDGEVFDMIVSNPPYIPFGTELSKEVQHEPAMALFANENGLEFYRKIIEQAPEYLTDGGVLLFELGIGEADSVKKMMEYKFENIVIENDLAGIERIIYGNKKNKYSIN